jgi:hypothetical protein
MFRVSAGILFLTFIYAIAMASDAHAAVIYCTSAGVPKGCVARVGVPVVTAPVARAVATPRVGVGDVNRGGPVNRVGVR